MKKLLLTGFIALASISSYAKGDLGVNKISVAFDTFEYEMQDYYTTTLGADVVLMEKEDNAFGLDLNLNFSRTEIDSYDDDVFIASAGVKLFTEMGPLKPYVGLAYSYVWNDDYQAEDSGEASLLTCAIGIEYNVTDSLYAVIEGAYEFEADDGFGNDEDYIASAKIGYWITESFALETFASYMDDASETRYGLALSYTN